MKKKGFTLIEIVISIAISVIIIGGIFAFLTKIQKDILFAKEFTKIHTSLTDFIGVMENFRGIYPTGAIVVEGSGVYNVGLLMNKDKTQGVLIGVVKEAPNNNSSLDLTSNKEVYEKKVLAYKKLSTNQINSILSDTGAVYGIKFTDDGLFKDIPVKDLTIGSYNSGAIFEYKIDVEAPFYEELAGQNRENIGPDTINPSFILDF